LFRNKYNFFSKFIHKLALSNNVVKDAAFDIEKFLLRNKKKPKNNQKNIFITGLARSGTTILNKFLYETGLFASLTYRDMPFVLSPNIWNFFTKNFYKQSKNIKRAHSDRIEINYDSPENFDEVFFKTKLSNSYISKNNLTEHVLNDEIISEFQIYVSNILLKNKKDYYLSKNNNNILRIESLSKAFPNSSFIVLFRDPIEQSNSLLTQHKNFIKLQTEDAFNLDYMNYLAHYEFGKNQKKFRFHANDLENNFDKLDICYWLSQWINVYGYLLDISNKYQNIHLINYEKLCDDPINQLMPIVNQHKIPKNFINSFKLIKAKKKSLNISDTFLKNKSLNLYEKLINN